MSFTSRPPRQGGNRPYPSRPHTDGNRSYSRPYQRRDEPYVERNDPLPPKDPTEVRVKPSFPEVKADDVFTQQQLGGLVIYFVEDDGEVIKGKHSHGYLTVKPRGQGPLTGYFRIKSIHGDGTVSTFPEKRAFVKQVESGYKLPKDAKLTHVHFQPS